MYNALFLVLLVRKIPNMKFLLYSTSEDLRRLRKYYRLEVQLAYLVDFAQFLWEFAAHFTFLHSKLVLHSFKSPFSWIHLNLVFCRGTACILNKLCPIFCYSLLWILLFSISFLVLHFIRSTFFMNIFSFPSLLPLAGRILDGLENTTG